MFYTDKGIYVPKFDAQTLEEKILVNFSGVHFCMEIVFEQIMVPAIATSQRFIYLYLSMLYQVFGLVL